MCYNLSTKYNNSPIHIKIISEFKIYIERYYCGFNGSSYFSETFKKVMGVTPRYRKRLHDNN